MKEKFKDRNGTEINIGDKVELEIELQVSSRWSTQGRKRVSFPVYQKKLVTFEVKYGFIKTTFSGEIITWYLTTDEKEEYNSTFWSGCGRTKAQKLANESRPVSHKLDRPLSKGLANRSKIIIDI